MNKQALKRLHFPHYIHYETRSQVLRSYKQLIRENNSTIDPLCRQYLREYINESFLAFKYVTSTPRINALIVQSDRDLEKLKQANRGTGGTGFEYILRWVFGRYKVREMPLTTLIGRREKTDLPFIINNITLPSERTYKDYENAMKNSTNVFYKYIRELMKKKYSRGENGRKLFYKINRQGHVLGKETPLNVQKNGVRKFMIRLLNDVPKPWSFEIMDYIQRQCNSNGITTKNNNNNNTQLNTKFISARTYRRRMKSLLNEHFSVQNGNEGKTINIVKWTAETVAIKNDEYLEL